MKLEEVAKLTHDQWREKAAEMKSTAETRLFIGGEFVDAVEGGTFLVNGFEEDDMTQPFGGFKQSGNARDKCFESRLSYMNAKAAWFRLN